jgi:hypothetical protein
VLHNRQADDLRAGFEIAERRAFGHDQTLPGSLPGLKPGFSDRALTPRSWGLDQSQGLSPLAANALWLDPAFAPFEPWRKPVYRGVGAGINEVDAKAKTGLQFVFTSVTASAFHS